MKKRNIILVTALLAIALAGSCIWNQASRIDDADVMREGITETEQMGDIIEQTVRIATHGDAKLETLSLSTADWEDFLKNYPGNVTISNLDIDQLFSFEEIAPEYPAEIVEFLENDKKPLMGIVSQFPENNGLFFGNGFYLSYSQSEAQQSAKTIEVVLETEDNFINFALNDSVNGKKLYCHEPYAENGIEFLLFTKDEKLFAINEGMKMFRLVPR